MAEQRFCKAKVGGSTPLPGSSLICNLDFVICGLVKWVVGRAVKCTRL